MKVIVNIANGYFFTGSKYIKPSLGDVIELSTHIAKKELAAKNVIRFDSDAAEEEEPIAVEEVEEKVAEEEAVEKPKKKKKKKVISDKSVADKPKKKKVISDKSVADKPKKKKKKKKTSNK